MVARALYALLEALPDNMIGEIIDGEVIASPRPAVPHAWAASRLMIEIGSRFSGPPDGPDTPGGWWILFEPELHFGDNVLVPDLAGWRRDRMPNLPDAAAMEIAPDWVCEVISPSTARIDRSRKMRIYAGVGVSHLWIVDPILRCVETYRLDRDAWIVAAGYADDEVVRAEPFDAVALHIRRWWTDPD